MDRLWAPWRLEYVTKKKPSECFLCESPASEDDRAAHILWRGTHAYVILNAFPYNNGHVMVAPYAHLAALEDMPPEVAHEVMDLAQLTAQVLRKTLRCEGMNVGFNIGAVGGAGLKDHLHLHLVPRWAGDTNFMPVIADTRVIPQALDRTWEVLSQGFAELTAD